MKIFITIILLALPMLAAAQIKATTEEGKSVLLFENGTWEYFTQETPQITETTSLKITDGLNKESDLDELYYAESKRLVKYFGPTKGKIKGRAKCMFVEGQAKIYFQWELGLLDSYRYFGHMKAGKKISLITKNNTSIDLILTEDIDMEFMEKYNFSILKGACMLNDDQFKRIMHSPISEMTVEWKKEVETYKLNDAYFFSRTFTELLK
ncbi:hypothetical protein [Saccharicrinis fermentans]|uniref:DUF3157 family protein n=1 Tax=Saccharicrinis fermentans DSM 9555 = JCM 21142 TaxID=869213 RepID=W7YNA6_9BACT|nr:hypothetical protein [Saccharicrinis fermentans]GAF03919.1 hypothetical protein JCM21142_72608 [Saccharicrinis fermentans DSM 9555 = JCM 21142]